MYEDTKALAILVPHEGRQEGLVVFVDRRLPVDLFMISLSSNRRVILRGPECWVPVWPGLFGGRAPEFVDVEGCPAQLD